MRCPSVSRHIEQEARFLVDDPRVHRAVAHLRVLEGFTLTGRRRERQTNTYFDTADFRLRQSGAVLKSRRIGRSREFMLKQSQGHRDGVLRHLEISARLRAARGQARVRPARHILAAGRQTEPMRLALRLARSAPLAPVLDVRTDRRCRIFSSRGQQVEVDVDAMRVYRGAVKLGERLEVEIENLTATPRVFRRAIEAVRRQFPTALRPSMVSKFEFGLACLRNAARR